jgi:iron(III) transport system ATP-binding protein
LIRITEVSRSFGPVRALRRISLHVREGESIALMGPSGSGKTTLLRIVAGLEPVDQGEVVIGGQVVSRPDHRIPPYRRGVGMVFQRPALWPHMTVARNVGFGLHRPRSDESRKRVNELLDHLDIAELLARRPHELSGGQARRVAIARALAPRPRILLLDEPFNDLDPELSLRVVGLIKSEVEASGATSILTAHDRSLASLLCPARAVFREGVLSEPVPWPNENETAPGDRR